MNFFKSLFIIIISLFMSSCATLLSELGLAPYGGIDKFYKPSNITLSLYSLLKEGEEPKVYYSSNINDDITFLKSNYYVQMGYLSFNGPADDKFRKNVENLCKDKKALVCLYGYNYTDTRTGVYSTSYGVSSYNIKRYDFTVIFYARFPQYYIDNQHSGFETIDLDTALRNKLQRNTGAVVDFVYNKSNAYYANLLKDDVIVEINGKNIYSSEDYYNYISGYTGKKFELKIIRNGEEKTIKYGYDWFK